MMKWCFRNGYLYSLFVELTYGCNLKCVHCYNPKNISSVQIDVNKMKEVIDQARELGVFHITFSGGEFSADKLEEVFAQACVKAGVNNYGYHGLRHTAGCRLANNGLPIQDIKESVGWAYLPNIMLWCR